MRRISILMLMYFALSALWLWSVATASVAFAQISAVSHNTWSSGAAIPTALLVPAVGVLGGQIYLVGGYNGAPLADTQIYNPATNTWSTTTPLPIPTNSATAAVVNNILYVIGGSTDGSNSQTNRVWAYSPKTKKWSAKTAMHTARQDAPAVVEKNIIYVIGGFNGSRSSGKPLATVESYNPASNNWTEEAPLLVAKQAPSVGLIGTPLTGFTIVAADGNTTFGPSGFTGDNEGYNASANAWSSLKSNATARTLACARSIGPQLYVAGGIDSLGPALSVTESYNLSKNTWRTRAPMPQPAVAAGSAVYKGLLYCFGGWASWNGSVLDSVQIYQP